MRPADWSPDQPRIPADTRPSPDRPHSSSPDPLRQRLENLPPGHPSSPHDTPDSGLPDRRHADVDRRERTADYSPHFTDAEWADHVTDVRTRLEAAHIAGLATDHVYTVDPDKSRWARDRRLMQNEIVHSLYAEAAEAPSDHKAIIAGGLAGAGKTTTLGSHAGIDTSKFLTINPDRIKAEMAVRGMIPHVDGLSPMEASDLVHEESSYVAKQLASRAQADGKNLIWDITMSSRESTKRRIDELRASSYTDVKGIFVDLPIELSIERADSRHRTDENKYRLGEGSGGRYVPPDITAAQSDLEWGSRNRATFESLKSHFDGWVHFDNGTTGRDPVLVESSSPDKEPRE